MKNNIKRRTLAFVFAAILASAPVCLAAQIEVPGGKAFPKDEIITAYGGREAIEKAASIEAKGNIAAQMLNDKGSYRRVFRRGGDLYVETAYAHSSEKRLLTGGRGWRSADNGPMEEVKDFRLDAMLYQCAYLDFPYGIMKDEYEATFRAWGALGGRTVKSFLLQREGLPLMEILIDAENFRILRAAGQFIVAGKPTTLSAEFGDFRKAGPLTLPFKTTYYSSGQKIAESIIESYALNPKGAGDVFNQPR